MDLEVYAGSRLERLPPLLRWPGLLVRNVVRPTRPPRATYAADGLTTRYASPFLNDRAWDEAYWDMAREWYPGEVVDVRWRMWILTSLARHARGVGGNFAEFGVFRGGCAYMMLRLVAPERLWLFDTFEGSPADHLSSRESRLGFAGRHSETSDEYVRSFLEPWSNHIEVIKGDVFATLDVVDTG